MQKFPQALIDKINQRLATDSVRGLRTSNSLVDFSSNDYLGLSKSRAIYDEAHRLVTESGFPGNGATGSRLISGNHALYTEAENFIAQFHNAGSALIFNSGYDANVGFFSTIPQKGDVVLYDEHIHASIRDGLRLSGASAYKFPHNDLSALKTLIKRYSDNEIYVVTESVFSMDGDSPNLKALAELCYENNCHLVIDEAHALGVFGDKGVGLVQANGIEDLVFARIMTFGKGLGCHGAAILGSSELKNYLVNFARSFIYTTALPPHSVGTILAAYQYLENHNKEQKQLQENITFFKAEIKRLEINCFLPSDSAIHCAIIPGNDNVKHTASLLQQNGFDVKAILSPTVPSGQERLRFCLHSYNTKQQITQVLKQLRSLLPPG